MEKYLLKTFVPADRFFHLHRAEITWSKLDAGHLHGYAEVFWVEKGDLFHVRNGVGELLHEGDVAWLRAGDSHAMRNTGKKTSIINLAFADSVLSSLERRYYSKSTPAPWKCPLNHRINHLDARQIVKFQNLANVLAFSPQTRLSLDNFLLDLLQTISMNNYHNITPQTDCPEWLTRAINEFAQKQLWNLTQQEFAKKLAGRSVEHVGRTVKKIFGKTTNELLNEYRLEKSAADLCITNKAVLEIAMDSGFDNLGYFYRLFKRHFNESPCRFRKLHQALIFTFTSGGKNGNCK